MQTFRSSPAYPASDLIAQKGTGLTISPAEGRITGVSGFSSMQAEAFGPFAGMIASLDILLSRSGTCVQGFLMGVAVTVV